ncbi:MAG: adenylate kinase [Flavobacteriales bacterium]|nr:adenylate kinase [Flavobacteriales bacterium]
MVKSIGFLYPTNIGNRELGLENYGLFFYRLFNITTKILPLTMEKEITLGDKTFKPFISKEKIDEQISRVAQEINRDYKGKKPLLVGILNGSVMFFSDLLKKIDIECEVAFLRVSSYKGTETTGNVKKVLGLDKNIEGSDVIIIEDIVDTGITLEHIVNDLSGSKPNSLKVATLLFKPNAYTKDYPIDYVGFEVGNEFLVGFGLDYNEIGRNLDELYIIKEPMLNIILFGPPGAGKGTQSELIQEKFNLTHLSTGDMFRFHMKNDTALGKKAKEYMEAGNLVPDQLVIDMIDNKLSESHDTDGFIFDGFPRTPDQATALDELLAKKDWEISKMVSLEVEENELVKRLLLRGKDSGRKDDSDESIIRNRMAVYNKETAPLKDFYSNQGKHIGVDGIGTIEEINGRINSALA